MLRLRDSRSSSTLLISSARARLRGHCHRKSQIATKICPLDDFVVITIRPHLRRRAASISLVRGTTPVFVALAFSSCIQTCAYDFLIALFCAESARPQRREWVSGNQMDELKHNALRVFFTMSYENSCRRLAICLIACMQEHVKRRQQLGTSVG